MGLRKTVFGMPKMKPNTFIGGVSATINTPALVAAKLGINVNRIKAFSVIGDNIQFSVIGGNYVIGSNAFISNTDITYYHDLDGLVTSFAGGNNFDNASNLREAKFKNVTSLPASAFKNTKLSGTNNDFSSVTTITSGTYGAFYSLSSDAGTVISLPSLTTLNSNAFTGHTTLSNNVTFRVPVALKTINAGNPHSELTSSALKAVIIEYIGFTDTTAYNTALGGYQYIYTNKGLLANFLGFGSGAIVNFRNDTTDVRFTFLINYTIATSKYQGNTTITYYHDLDGLVTAFAGTNIFDSASNFKEAKFKNVTSLPSATFKNTKLSGTNNDFSSVTTIQPATYGAFYNLSSDAGTVISLPSLTTLNLNAFTGHTTLSNNVTFRVPVAFMTSDSGKPHSELTSTTLKSVIIEYIGFTEDSTFNTSIGNYGIVYANKGLLATANGIGSGAIINFRNDAGTLKFKALISYTPKNYNGDSIITHYKDLEGLNLTITATGFRSTNNITEIVLAGCTNLGGSTLDNSVFNNIKTGATITVPAALQTANAGAPDGDLAYAATSRAATIVYV